MSNGFDGVNAVSQVSTGFDKAVVSKVSHWFQGVNHPGVAGVPVLKVSML